MRHILRKNRGFTLVESLIAIGIIGVTLVAATSFTNASNQIKRKSDISESVYKFRENLVNSLRSSDALAYTATANGVGCLQTRQNCSTASTPYSDLAVKDRDGSFLTQPASANFGFGIDAQPCTSFPSATCPFRYVTQWRSLCSGGATCISPQLKARGDLQVYESVRSVFNPANYEFEITMGQVIGSYEQGCTSVGGIYLPGPNPQCSLPIEGDCPTAADGSQQRVVGFDRSQANGNRKICEPVFKNVLNGIVCAVGTVMIGTDAAGNPVCRPIRPNPVAPVGSGPPVTRPFACQEPNPPASCSAPAVPITDGGGGDGGCGGGGDGCF